MYIFIDECYAWFLDYFFNKLSLFPSTEEYCGVSLKWAVQCPCMYISIDERYAWFLDYFLNELSLFTSTEEYCGVFLKMSYGGYPMATYKTFSYGAISRYKLRLSIGYL